MWEVFRAATGLGQAAKEHGKVTAGLWKGSALLRGAATAGTGTVAVFCRQMTAGTARCYSHRMRLLQPVQQMEKELL
jgi:hypothetical protein